MAIGILNHRSPTEEIQHRLRKQQRWQSVAGEIQRSYVLAELAAPFSILIHLGQFQVADRIALQTEVELFIGGYEPLSDGGGEKLSVWSSFENHELSFEKPSPGPMRLKIDDQSVGPQDVVIMEAPQGPWRARINYVQNFGTSKPMKYMVF